MNVEYTARKYELTPIIRKEVETGLNKIRKILGDRFETKVILAVEKRRHKAEITINPPNGPIVGVAQTTDMMSAVTPPASSVCFPCGLRSPNHMRRHDDQQCRIAFLFVFGCHIVQARHSFLTPRQSADRPAFRPVQFAYQHHALALLERDHAVICAIIENGIPINRRPRQRVDFHIDIQRNVVIPHHAWSRFQGQPQILILHLRYIRHAAS